jgi:hypothetical protein
MQATFVKRVDVNEVKTEARRGVLNGTPLFIPEKFQSFIVQHLFGSEPSTQFPEALKP